MKLRRLHTPAALAVLALSPLAVTTSATAGGIPTNHNLVFADEDGTAVTTPAVDIVSTHLLRTANDFRAIVTLKKLSKLPASRWTVDFQADGIPEGSETYSRSGNVVDYRVTPAGVASTVAYGITDAGQLVKSSCRGNSVTPDYAKNTLTFVINKNCWYSKFAPSQVNLGTMKYASANAYNQGTPIDTIYSMESPTSDHSSYTTDCGWDWGGDQSIACQLRPGKASRLHM